MPGLWSVAQRRTIVVLPRHRVSSHSMNEDPPQSHRESPPPETADSDSSQSADNASPQAPAPTEPTGASAQHAAGNSTGNASDAQPAAHEGAAGSDVSTPVVSKHEGKLLFGAVVLLTFLLALGVSYLDEDAFISFRVVDNFVNGFGLRWNVDERVQVYTNPLWVLALIPLHSFFSNIAWASYLLSAASSTAAVATIAWPLRRNPFVLLCAFLLPLLLSQAFTDYTSSGLENPFIYLFAALFCEQLFRPGAFEDEERTDTWRRLCLFAALSATTRADTFLLYAPVLVATLLTERKRPPFKSILLGASPLLAWLAFAYLYYGTIFPNPKYAKLDGGIPRSEYLEFGWTYLLDMARNDVVTFAGLVAAPTGMLFGLLGPASPKRLIGAKAAWVLSGATLYEIYVIWIGGDFMAGRHWAAPFFLTVCTSALRLKHLLTTREIRLPATRILYAALFLLGLRFVVQPIARERDVIARRNQGRFAIVREGEIRYQRYNCGFYEALLSPRGSAEQHSWSQDGIKEARRAVRLVERKQDERHVVVSSAAGKGPYFAGPLVIYIDPLGITDPLLARLPDADGRMRLVGHLKRKIPRGYVKARRTGDTSSMDPYLRKYYEALRLVTSGPLLSAERLRTMLRMTGGAYEHLLQKYLERTRKRRPTRILHHGHH